MDQQTFKDALLKKRTEILGTGGIKPLHRSALDHHLAMLQVGDGVFDRPAPFKTDVAVAGLHRKASDFGRFQARTMQIELRVAEAIGPSDVALDELSAKHILVE